ncbi:hypothetical protein ABZ734_10205 [Streptomyces sp. NPDC006660]|uniref:hypothetical protein n=1 Tax=Streptomyces sp. NPDC006660 TaxID=3156901 RepID=UPI0034048A00
MGDGSGGGKVPETGSKVRAADSERAAPVSQERVRNLSKALIPLSTTSAGLGKPDVKGSPLPHTPRYSLSGGFVAVSPHTDQRTHEALLAETYGSVDWLWSGDDEIRFAKADSMLRGFTLAVPERGAPDAWDPTPWLSTPLHPGVLHALSPGNFEAKPTEMRWVDDSAQHLICAFSDVEPATHGCVRVRAAQGFDFVFAGGVYVGWILSAPADFLVREWELPPADEAPAGLAGALHAYLGTFVEPKIDRMQDKDAALLREVDSLLARLALLPADPRRDVIAEHVADLRADWYEL